MFKVALILKVYNVYKNLSLMDKDREVLRITREDLNSKNRFQNLQRKVKLF